MTADEVIDKFGLKPLPGEGGYYRESYRSDFSTAIYYLITPTSFSALHRILSDEVFHFYAGDAAEMIQIESSGALKKWTLGSDFANGESLQVVVPAKTWQATRLKQGGSWALIGTTVAPGFEFADLEIGYREEMKRRFPEHSDEIIRFTQNAKEP